MKAKAKLRPGVLAAAAAALAFFPQEARATSCISGPFMIFFDLDDASLTAHARALLGNLVSARGSCGPGTRIRIIGYADRSGSAAHNLSLSRRRADNVRAYLLSLLVEPGDMDLEAAGESLPLVVTADGVREEQNRRVELQYVP